MGKVDTVIALTQLAKVAQIQDPKLQSSEFVSVLNGLANGSIRAEGGNLVQATEGQKMANDFLAEQRWSDQFVQGNSLWYLSNTERK